MANSNNVPTNSPITNNQSQSNQSSMINPNQAYGLQQNTGCLQGTCPPEVLGAGSGYYIPSLQEIASYNRYEPTQYAPITKYQGELHEIPAVAELEAIDANQPPLSQNTLQTPATTLNYGATMGPLMQRNLDMDKQISDYSNPYPVTPESIQFLNGFIRTQIGRRATIDFLVGSNQIVSKTGYLLGVAANYILINELDTNDITTCDFYNIKFIRFYY